MEELDIISSFNPLDALESISQIYSAKQLSKVELEKIRVQAQCFNKWILEQRKDNVERRKHLISQAEEQRKYVACLMDKILENPELAITCKDIFSDLLKSNNELAKTISDIRIQSK